MRKFIASLVVLCSISAPAYAWGEREQGALAGIAATLLFQHIHQPRPHTQPQVTVQPTVPYHYGTTYPDYTHRPMYKAVDVFIPECRCYRTVMVQIN